MRKNHLSLVASPDTKTDIKSDGSDVIAIESKCETALLVPGSL